MLKEVQGYQTTDGKFWEDMDEATAHQKTIDIFNSQTKKKTFIIEQLIKYENMAYREKFIKYVKHPSDHANEMNLLIYTILRNPDELQEILNGLKEIQ